MGSGPGIACRITLNTRLSPEDQALFQDPGMIQDILLNGRTVAMVGLSADPQKPSSFVASYLKAAGWTVYPVNPRGGRILGLEVYPDIASLPGPVDVVDIFRPEAEVPAILEAALAKGCKVLWQQLRIRNLEAARAGRAAGLGCVLDLCMKMEHGRYGGGLHESGMNTELVSARRSHRYF